MNRSAIIIGIIAAALSANIFAADIGHEYEDDGAMSFQTLDQNNDGVLEEMEVLNLQDDHDYEGAEFENIDEDGNSEITEDEWNNFFRNQ